MCPIFVIKFSGLSDLQGVKVPDFPLTLLVIVTTVLRYRAACDGLQWVVSYWLSIVTNPLCCMVLKILRLKDLGVMTLSMWSHVSNT